MRAPDADRMSDSDNGWRQMQREKLTPENGFTLVGTDRLADIRGELYEIERFDNYQDALNAKKSRDRPEEYLVLYKDAQGSYCHR